MVRHQKRLPKRHGLDLSVHDFRMEAAVEKCWSVRVSDLQGRLCCLTSTYVSRPIRDGKKGDRRVKPQNRCQPGGLLCLLWGEGGLLCLLCLVGRVGGTYYTVLAAITVSAWPRGGGATLLPASVSAVTACRRMESAHNLTLEDGRRA